MQSVLLVLLPIFAITGYFFPKTASVIAAVLWMWVLIGQFSSRGIFKCLDCQELEKLGVDSDGRACLLRYALFFKMPYASMGISNAASLWLMACFPWAIILWFQGEPLFIACPIFVAATCFYLCERLHPLLYLSHQARGVAGRGIPGSHPFEANFLTFAKTCRVVFMPDAPIIGFLDKAIEEIYPNSLFAKTGEWHGRT